jgi:hypothetical protein
MWYNIQQNGWTIYTGCDSSSNIGIIAMRYGIGKGDYLKQNNHKICIISLGHVGLPLTHTFNSKYSVVALDLSNKCGQIETKNT